MSAELIKKKLIISQKGMGLPAAIFIITVMALIAAAVNQLVSQNAQTYEEAVDLTRAFYAAESGAGFGMNTIFPPEDYPAYTANTNKCPGTPGPPIPTIYTFTVDGLRQCRAEVTCTEIATDLKTHYATIESKGICGNVERAVQVRTVYTTP